MLTNGRGGGNLSRNISKTLLRQCKKEPWSEPETVTAGQHLQLVICLKEVAYHPEINM
jgi:hypothetical protein